MGQPTQQFKRIATGAAARAAKTPDSKSFAPKANPQGGAGGLRNQIELLVPS
jgi:hypothetical protein